MLADWISLLIGDFGFFMFVLALIFILFHSIVRIRYVSFYEIVFRWMALFAVGFSCIFAFIMHMDFPQLGAMAGWNRGPYQYDLAMGFLTIGILGFISFKASYGFRLATTIAVTCWMWTNALSHMYQLILTHQYTLSHVAPWAWLELIIPLILMDCMLRLRPMLPVATVITV